jgi:sulfur transfer complex TusBCD TusB component (DsrH family)
VIQLNLHDENMDDYSYLWDGSEDWGLSANYNHQSNVKIVFCGNKPTMKEIAAVRKLITAYQNIPAIEVKSLLSNRKEIDLGILSSMEANRIKKRAVELNLTIIAVDSSYTSYLPINRTTNHAFLIEDDALARRVTAKMLKFGVPIIDYTEID